MSQCVRVCVCACHGRLMASLLHNDTHLAYSSLGSGTKQEHCGSEYITVRWQAVWAIDYNYTTAPKLLHTLYTLTKHFQLPLICYIPISGYINDIKMLLIKKNQKNKLFKHSTFCVLIPHKAKLERQEPVLCNKVHHQHCKFKADDSHHGANSVLSMPKVLRNRGMAQLRALAYYNSLGSPLQQ